jgi:2-keto-4-pentenoate hydratase/2-oxohepta-3-ene-1,7-dioic acid hydratase in catechol pathway
MDNEGVAIVGVQFAPYEFAPLEAVEDVGRSDPRYLQLGDTVEVEIERVGSLTNSVRGPT